MAKSIVAEFTKGLWKEIPPFRLVLGLCPTLGVTTSMKNGIGMGLATTFVLLCSNILVSLLRKVIPSKVRIACFIIIIATFVIVVEQMMAAYAYTLFMDLGVFIPLIVVNCIVLGRAEAFASKNGIATSAADGLGIGVGFTLSLASLGAVRELLGTGSLKGDIFGFLPYHFSNIFGSSFEPFGFAVQAPGAFIALGLMLCAMNLIPSK
ncbi:putative inner membrane NADH-quinone reductase [Desulfosarcina cetonica]|uniref:electron transport complex subunit RsxE n=1 Tax=Desulfosarcina cetonica TaxID=90730 RepID=UPI0006D09AA5|nr:electron transport complex subunit E [Desulfosarcina cetonica]VTR67614.1 putative inner membrane NADH-quinone reductase [Desulfosarcina cetonica]